MKNREKYTTVLFDLDGTLLDTSPGILKAVDATVQSLGFKELSLTQKRLMIGPPIEQSFQKVYCLSQEDASHAAAVFRKIYAEEYLMDATPYPGILDLLRWMKAERWKIGIATYKRNDYAQTLMFEKGILPLVDIALGSRNSTETKADVIRICLSALQTEPRTTLMVGDTLHDYTGAVQAECSFIGVTYGFGFQDKKEIQNVQNAIWVNSASELKNFLIS